MDINGTTRVCGLIGNPVAHSISPVIHNRLAGLRGDNLVYATFKVEAGNVAAAVKGAYALDILGLNVTVPHKQAVIDELVDIDGLAAAIGAVNTLVRTEGGFKGYNTDILGLDRELSDVGISLEDKCVVIIGAGGAARAIAFLCAGKKASEIYIMNRTLEKAQNIADAVNEYAKKDIAKAAGNVRDISKSRYARKLKRKAKMQGKKGARNAKSSVQKPTAAQDTGASGTGEGGSNWLSRWRQKQDIRQSYYAAARSGTAAQTAGGKAASNGASAARSGVEQAVEKGKTAVSTAVKGLVNAAKGNAHVLVIVGVFLLLVLMVMSGFSSCGILFSGGTQVSGQTIYSAEDRDIWGAEQDYKKLEKELDKKIKRTPTDHPGYNEYQYHLDPIEHDPWQLTSFLTTLYDDYTRSEVQGKLKETFKKQYKLTTWVEVQIRYKTVWVISPAGIPVPTQVPYEYKIFHTKLVNRGLEVVIREELDNDQWKRYEIFQDTLGGRPYLFNGGLPPGGSDGSGTPGIDYQVPAEALTDSEFAAIYKEAQKYVGTPYVWGGSTPETGFDCSGYVCWVYNQNGYDVGRTTANGLWNKSQHISEADAKPGDLVFFKGTYDTPGMSHTGIYLGNGMMVSAGDPIKYANIHSSYWEKHLAGFGRLSK